MKNTYKEISNSIEEIYKQYNDDNCNNWMQLLIIKNKKIKITKLLNSLNKKNIQCKKAWSNIDRLDFLKKFPKMKIEQKVISTYK